MHLHHHGIPVEYYTKYTKLNDFFKILSTNIIDGQAIVSSAEARNYPIYIVQYHPEVIYDPADDLNSVRTPTNYKIAQAFSNFFASECDKNNHYFKDN